MVKKGGKLIYSTCTINKGENEEVVHNFFYENIRIRITTNRRVWLYKGKSMLTILPHEYHTDGFSSREW